MRSPYRDAVAPRRFELSARRDRVEASLAALEAADELTRAERRRAAELRAVLRRPIDGAADVDAAHAALDELRDIVTRRRPPQPRYAIPAAVVAAAFILPFAPLGVSWASRYRAWDDACERSVACDREGRCARPALEAALTTSPGDHAACVAVDDGLCRVSEVCRREGRCVARAGACTRPER